MKAIEGLGLKKESYFIPGEGRHEMERSVVFVECGKYIGYGYVDHTSDDLSTEDLKEVIRKRHHNHDTERILQAFLKKNPERIPLRATPSGRHNSLKIIPEY